MSALFMLSGRFTWDQHGIDRHTDVRPTPVLAPDAAIAIRAFTKTIEESGSHIRTIEVRSVEWVSDKIVTWEEP